MSISQNIKKFYQQLRYPELQIKQRISHRRYGSAYGGWDVHTEALNSESIVYSFGVGEDISFDLELIKQHNCTIYAFDPTPRSITWVKNQNLSSKFRLLEYGIADFDGEAQFFPPENPEYVSHTILNKTSQSAIALPVKKLKTIMQELGHQKLDLLKLDIEGAEYTVLEDILRDKIEISQLLLEFHHRWDGIGFEKTRAVIRQLKAHGYQVFAFSQQLEEFSFLRQV